MSFVNSLQSFSFSHIYKQDNVVAHAAEVVVPGFAEIEGVAWMSYTLRPYP